MPSATVVIVGGGIAGAACAYFLSRLGVGGIVCCEQEEQPGLHASGRNAAMARQVVADPAIQALAVAGVRFLYQPPPDVADRPLIRADGSLLLFSAAGEGEATAAIAAAHRHGVVTGLVRRAECEARVACLADADYAGGIWTPTDGVVDIHALLHGFVGAARDRGAAVVTSARVAGIEPAADGFTVRSDGNRWHCRVLVNAAGAWADRVAAMAGVAPRGLRAYRRHLFHSEPLAIVDPAWPFVWDQAHEYYFRPESGGLLLSPCDETEISPGPAGTDAEAAVALADKLARSCPRLAGIRIARAWAGLRTFAPDRRFLLGWDEAVPGFYWIAGLGGHGITCAAAVGEAAARQIAERLA